MVIACSAFGCAENHSKQSTYNFFRFPKSKALKNKWAHAVKPYNWKPDSSAWICSQHFQTGKPNKDPGHPDYVPNIFTFTKVVAAPDEQMSPAKTKKRNLDSSSQKVVDAIQNIATQNNGSSSVEVIFKEEIINVDKAEILSTVLKNKEIHQCDLSVVKHFCEEKITDADKVILEDLKVTETHKCELCLKQFSSKSCLTMHNECHHQAQPKVCDICSETFASEEDFTYHVAQHSLQTCFPCDKVFFDKDGYESHQSPHNVSKGLYTCDLCMDSFKSEDEQRKHHKLCNEKKFHCLTCKKYFKLKGSLERHWQSHAEMKPYQCTLCNAGFTQKVGLRKHLLVQHEKIKPFLCDMCGKSFSVKASLDVHMLNHMGEKPYRCLVCGNGFTSQRNLKRHGMVHMPKQPSTCGVCGKVLGSKLKLGMHFLVHTDERPYRCELCNKSFTYTSHLKRHMNLHNK